MTERETAVFDCGVRCVRRPTGVEGPFLSTDFFSYLDGIPNLGWGQKSALSFRLTEAELAYLSDG